MDIVATQEAAAPTHAATITVRTDQLGAAINPGMWGIFLEDINFGIEGGIYAGLVKNRSFEFPHALMGWSARQHGKNLHRI